MKFLFARGPIGDREGSLIFNEEIKKARFSDLKPKSRSKLYVTKTNRLTFIRFPWREVNGEPLIGEITLTEHEIFRLAHHARRDKSDEDLIKAIRRASSA